MDHSEGGVVDGIAGNGPEQRKGERRRLARTSPGTQVTLGVGGRYVVDISNIRAVGIKNVTDVEEHSVTTVASASVRG